MRKSNFVRIAALLLAASGLFMFAACGGGPKFMEDKDMVNVSSGKNPTGKITLEFELPGSPDKHFLVELEFELFYDKAPITVTNFIKLVNDEFYNDPADSSAAERSRLTVDSVSEAYASFGYKYFEKVLEDEDDQSSDRNDTYTTVEPAYTVIGEFEDNEYEKNDITFKRGTMFMLRTGDNNSAYSRFAIADTVKDADYKGKYAAFGQITRVRIWEDGDEKEYGQTAVEIVFNEIQKLSLSSTDRDTHAFINKIEIDTHGVDYKLGDFVKNWTIKVAA